jgi:hypothetical protein
MLGSGASPVAGIDSAMPVRGGGERERVCVCV